MQRRWRGHSGRQKYLTMLAEMEAARRDRAARKLQAWARAQDARKNYAAYLKHKVQTQAATVIQAQFRRVLASKHVNAIRRAKREQEAALFIQRVQRGRLGRQIMAARRQERLELLSAIKIQKVTRGRQGRRRVWRIHQDRIERAAAIAIQKRARGMVWPTFSTSVPLTTPLAWCKDRITRFLHGWQVERRYVAKLRQEKVIERAKQSAAALKVQKVYRGHRARLTTRLKMNQAATRRKIESKAATTIIAGMRGMHARIKVWCRLCNAHPCILPICWPRALVFSILYSVVSDRGESP